MAFEIFGVLMTIVGAVTWLLKQHWIAASLCGVGALMLLVAVLIARSRVRQYFLASLLTLSFGLLLVGTAIGVTISGGGPSEAKPAASASPSVTSAPSPTPHISPPTSMPSASASGCKTPPYSFARSSVTGSIDKPADKAAVAWRFDISGTLPSLPGDRTLYVTTEVIGPKGQPIWDRSKCFSNRVWPVRISVDAEGKWKTSIAVGDENSNFAKLIFKVTLVLVDEKTEFQFDTYIREAAAGKDLSGVGTDSFAGRIEELDNITVTRQ